MVSYIPSHSPELHKPGDHLFINTKCCEGSQKPRQGRAYIGFALHLYAMVTTAMVATTDSHTKHTVEVLRSNTIRSPTPESSWACVVKQLILLRYSCS